MVDENLEELETQKKKKRQQQLLEHGRLLGTIAKIDKDLYEIIKQEAEKNGDNPHQIIVANLKKYYMLQRAQEMNLTVDQLLLAWDILERMLKFSMWLHMSLATQFFSELTSAYGRLIDERVKQYQTMLEQQQKQEKSKDIMGRMLDMILPLLEGQLKQWMASYLKATGQPIPQNLKLNIPVNLRIRGEDAQETTDRTSEA